MKTQIPNPKFFFEKGKYLAKAFLLIVVLCSKYSLTAQVSWCTDACSIGGNSSTGVGLNVMPSITTYGNRNTAVGEDALSSIIGTILSPSDNNTAVGFGALNGTDAIGNTAVGCFALFSNATGQANTAGGWNALLINTGDECTAFGAHAMENSNGTGNTGLGYFADSPPANNYATAIGAYSTVNASNRVWIGSTTDDVWCQTAVWGTSDQRFKYSVKQDDVKGLEFIKLLRPVVYNFDTKKLTEHLTKHMSEGTRRHHMERDFNKSSAVRQSGFIAQEVETAAKKAGYDFSGVHVPESDIDTYGLSYAQFVVPMVKAIQEQQNMIEQQQQRIDALEKSNSDLLNKSSNPTGIDQINSLNDGFSMEQNIPNPFTNETVVKYNLPQSINKAFMAIYDLTGKQITTLPITEKGASQMTLTSEKLSAGIYIYSIVGDGKILDSKRMVIGDK